MIAVSKPDKAAFPKKRRAPHPNVSLDHMCVDPGVTAQLECLLDDVVVGKQEMVGAIDAVCDVAQRIIGKLKDGAVTGGPPLLGVSVGNGAGG